MGVRTVAVAAWSTGAVKVAPDTKRPTSNEAMGENRIP